MGVTPQACPCAAFKAGAQARSRGTPALTHIPGGKRKRHENGSEKIRYCTVLARDSHGGLPSVPQCRNLGVRPGWLAAGGDPDVTSLQLSKGRIVTGEPEALADKQPSEIQRGHIGSRLAGDHPDQRHHARLDHGYGEARNHGHGNLQRLGHHFLVFRIGNRAGHTENHLDHERRQPPGEPHLNGVRLPAGRQRAGLAEPVRQQQ